MGQQLNGNITRMAAEAGVLTYVATAASASVATGALTEFVLQAPTGFVIPDHDAKLWSIELAYTNLGVGVTSVTWALFRQTGQVGLIAGPVQAAITTFPSGTKINGYAGYLDGLPYEKLPTIGVSGQLYLVCQAAGANAVDVIPRLTFTAPNNTPVGIYQLAVP